MRVLTLFNRDVGGKRLQVLVWPRCAFKRGVWTARTPIFRYWMAGPVEVRRFLQ